VHRRASEATAAGKVSRKQATLDTSPSADVAPTPSTSTTRRAVAWNGVFGAALRRCSAATWSRQSCAKLKLAPTPAAGSQPGGGGASTKARPRFSSLPTYNAKDPLKFYNNF